MGPAAAGQQPCVLHCVLPPRGRVEHRGALFPLAPQPEGPSWSVEGNMVTWEGWQFHLGFSWREGLIINDLKARRTAMPCCLLLAGRGRRAVWRQISVLMAERSDRACLRLVVLPILPLPRPPAPAAVLRPGPHAPRDVARGTGRDHRAVSRCPTLPMHWLCTDLAGAAGCLDFIVPLLTATLKALPKCRHELRAGTASRALRST